MLELGGNITLVGFKELEKAELVVVKKIVGRYARKMSDTLLGFKSLRVSLKPVHKTEAGEKYEIHAKAMVEGRPVNADTTERNLFVGLDSVLKNILQIVGK